MTKQRVYAHYLRYQGRKYREHVLELSSDGTVSLYPFTQELPRTRFYPGEVDVCVLQDTKGHSYLDVRPIQREATIGIPPLTFRPIFKNVIWGGERISRLKRLPVTDSTIGESWEVSAVPGLESIVANGPDTGLTLTELVELYGPQLVGESCFKRFGHTFPLLVKILDAHRDLSLQVHPNDELAMERHGCLGKSEMWYVVDAAPAAAVYAGFKHPVTVQDYDAAVESGSICELVDHLDTHPGDVFYIPAGLIHGLGAGNLVVEVQETSDISYRIDDFGRIDSNGLPRPLHIKEARGAVDFNGCLARVNANVNINSSRPDLSATDSYRLSLLCSPNFDVDYINVRDYYRLDLEQHPSFMILTCIGGSLDVTDDRGNHVTLNGGQTCMLPAVATRADLRGTGALITSTRL